MNQGGNGNGSHGGARREEGRERNGQSRPRAAAGGIDRMPPQAVEVEQAVFGAMMIDSRAIGRALKSSMRAAFITRRMGQFFRR